MTDFSEALFDEICDRISDGESLRGICSEKDMPNKATVFRWLAQDEKLSDQYARAMEARADVYADEIVSIADEAKADDVQQARLRVDARKWVASKLKPKKYGDKVSQEISGPDGGAIPVTEVAYKIIDPKETNEA